jgi:Uncharacterized conserved protein
MQNAYTAADFRQADETAMTRYGIPGVVLMENAGRGACEVLLKRYPEANDFLILCGPGNNGGDGFVIARHLALNGRRVFIITPPHRKHTDRTQRLTATARPSWPSASEHHRI